MKYLVLDHLVNKCLGWNSNPDLFASQGRVLVPSTYLMLLWKLQGGTFLPFQVSSFSLWVLICSSCLPSISLSLTKFKDWYLQYVWSEQMNFKHRKGESLRKGINHKSREKTWIITTFCFTLYYFWWNKTTQHPLYRKGNTTKTEYGFFK